MASPEAGLSTVHLYYEDTEQFSCEAKVLAEEQLENSDLCLVLDRTVMHPQGGR